MKTKRISPVGALHPILFFAGVYVVVLAFSIFICSSLFYTFNPRSSSGSDNSSAKETPVRTSTPVAATVAMR